MIKTLTDVDLGGSRMAELNAGFSRDDVTTIREAAKALEEIAKTANTDVSGELKKLAPIADRIEALLQPSHRI